MEPKRLLQTAIIPAMAELTAFGIKDSPEARRFMLAISLQESGLAHRRQVSAGGKELGAAAGWWQFEMGGGCKGVLSHAKTAPVMLKLCDAFNVKAEPLALWEAIRYQDILAACAARLLIFTLSGPLPQTADDGWAQYLRAWRPGAYPQGSSMSDRWLSNWATADAAVKGVI